MVSKACLVGAYQSKLSAIGRSADIDLTVIVPPFWREPGGDLRLERGDSDGYRLLVEPIRLNGRHHLHWYPRLGHRLRELRPDVVHMDEEPYSLVTWLGMRQARALGARPLFFSWQNIFRRYPPPFGQMERQVLAWADHGIMGNAAADEVWRRKGYRGPTTILPQFGVSLELFRERGPFSADTPFLIGSASRRLAPEKGVDLILQAATALPGDWRVRVAGDGDDRARLEGLAQSLGIADRVDFVGKVGSEAVADFLRGLDVLVLPSRTTPTWKEQFGRVLIEAMACGVPVIGSDSGEIPHVIGEDGLVFAEDDLAGLTARLTALATDCALRTRLGQAGRRRVAERYTQAQIAARTVDIYRAVMAKPAILPTRP
jgi:glycosyltransferase involved in cell wall biosynthesis